MWGKREDELERCILTLHFYFYFKRSIICTWRSASGFHNNLSHWKTAGSANLQLSAFQGLLMEPRFPVRQAATLLARAWWAGKRVGAQWSGAAVWRDSSHLSLVASGGRSHSEGLSASSEARGVYWCCRQLRNGGRRLPFQLHTDSHLPVVVNLHEHSTHSLCLLNSCN